MRCWRRTGAWAALMRATSWVNQRRSNPMSVFTVLRAVQPAGSPGGCEQQPDGPLCITHVDGAFSAYDSPELATLISNTATQSNWRVESGGRVGFVVGEDAVEGGCTPQTLR